MKILYYNWVQFDDLDRRGGGVTVYQDNLVKEMIRLGHDVSFFSSGLSYSLVKAEAFIRRTQSHYPECKSFEIVNSAVMAPGHASWGGEDVMLTDRSMIHCMRDFVARHGPFDVVHFQNLEGIPLAILSREVFGEAKLFFSAHNYFAVCPQVNLWRYETANCIDYNGGQSCTYCLPHKMSHKRNLVGYQVQHALNRLGMRRRSKRFLAAEKALLKLRSAFHLFNRLRYASYLKRSKNPVWRFVYGKKNPDRLTYLAARRATIAEAFRQNGVTTIAVSERTREVICRYGLDEDASVTAYIGTGHAARFARAERLAAPRVPGQFTVAYLGYMRRDKGFYFFLDCLERMPRSLAAAMNVVVAAKDDRGDSVERLMKLNGKFRSIAYYDGFTAKELDHVLRGTDLGLVPALWEDNLPQVAIEVVSRGIPILVSDLGGAQEIARNPDFVFKANDALDFLRALRRLATGEVPLSTFWRPEMGLLSMADHSAELLRIYRAEPSPAGPFLEGGSEDAPRPIPEGAPRPSPLRPAF